VEEKGYVTYHRDLHELLTRISISEDFFSYFSGGKSKSISGSRGLHHHGGL
jgi:hypothetical protein